MTSFRGKFRVVASLAALFLLAGAISCKGFFVNPTLTGITVSCPTCNSTTSPNLSESGSGSTAKLIATGNYDDSSTKNLTGSVNWSSGDDTKITVNNTDDKGRITAVDITTSAVTIKASTTDNTLSGSIAVTVGQTPTTVSCQSCTSGNNVSIAASGGTVTFTASTASTWAAQPSSIMTIVGNGTSATGTLNTNTGDVTVTATPTGSGAAGSLVIHVNQ